VAFFAKKERFLHLKTSSFLPNEPNVILYFQRLTGFVRLILTSFLPSAFLGPQSGPLSLPPTPGGLALPVIIGNAILHF
jgi:hypothetical protein